MYKSYRFRIYPNEDQETLIVKHIGSCRFVWNHFLDMRNKRYAETGKGMTYKEMALLLPALKKENKWKPMPLVSTAVLTSSISNRQGDVVVVDQMCWIPV